MGTIVRFPETSGERKARTARDGKHEVVAMKHVDLDTVIETVRVLRTLSDQSFLDRYNRTEPAGSKSAAG